MVNKYSTHANVSHMLYLLYNKQNKILKQLIPFSQLYNVLLLNEWNFWAHDLACLIDDKYAQNDKNDQYNKTENILNKPLLFMVVASRMATAVETMLKFKVRFFYNFILA